MKKIAIIFAFALILGLSLNSCRSAKPPCPAYQAVQIEQLETTNIAR